MVGGHAVHDTYTAFLPPMLPLLIQKFALSTAQAGLLSVFLQWPSVAQPFIGYLADHINLRYLVICAPAITGIAMSLLGIAPSYVVLAMLLIVVGIGAAGLHAVGPVIVGNVAGSKLGRGMGLWMVGGGLGYTVGPLLIVAVLERWSLQGTPWLMLGGFLASAVLYLRLRDVSSYSAKFHQARPWREALQVMRPLLAPVIGITVARSFMSSAMTTYLPTFLSREGNSLWFAGAALSIYEAAGMVRRADSRLVQRPPGPTEGLAHRDDVDDPVDAGLPGGRGFGAVPPAPCAGLQHDVDLAGDDGAAAGELPTESCAGERFLHGVELCGAGRRNGSSGPAGRSVRAALSLCLQRDAAAVGDTADPMAADPATNRRLRNLTMSVRFKAILFDLDGTLLDSHMDRFLPHYMRKLADRVAHLIPPAEFVAHLLAGTQAMVANDGRATNAQVFAETFYPAVGHAQAELEPIFMDFYAKDYASLQPLTACRPEARPAVQMAFDLGYEVVIATNPLFPEVAIRQRMAWAGVADFPYRRVTTFENSHFAKPNPRYFGEIPGRHRLPAGRSPDGGRRSGRSGGGADRLRHLLDAERQHEAHREHPCAHPSRHAHRSGRAAGTRGVGRCSQHKSASRRCGQRRQLRREIL